MIKKSVKSYYLSLEASTIIEGYKTENRLGSSSLALEKILLDEYTKVNTIDEEYILDVVRKIIKEVVIEKNLNTGTVKTKEEIEKESNEIVDKDMMKSMLDAMNSIKEK